MFASLRRWPPGLCTSDARMTEALPWDPGLCGRDATTLPINKPYPCNPIIELRQVR